MNSVAQIIIFSKDRPAQLELLLRSLRRALLDPDSARVTVLYKAEAALEAAYLDLSRQYDQYRFANEGASPSFQTALLGLLDPAATYLSFLVDDQVFLRPFRLAEILQRFAAAGPACASVSLRMHPGIKFSYCFRTISPPRTLDRDSLKFNWADEPNNSDWSVVMTLDGNLYRTEDLLPILSRTVYQNPCFLEEQMVKNCPFSAGTFCLCQPEPLVVTVPINQTQDTHFHRHANLADLASLNQSYLQGSRLALLPFWETTGGMVHREQTPLLLSSATDETPPADSAEWRQQKTSWNNDLLAAELRAVAEHQFPLSTRTWRNTQPVLPPLVPGLKCPPTTGQFVERQFADLLNWLPHQAFLFSRQIAYSILSTTVWFLGQPFKGGWRDKVVSLFAGRPATHEEVHRRRPPQNPWKKAPH